MQSDIKSDLLEFYNAAIAIIEGFSHQNKFVATFVNYPDTSVKN